MKVVSIKFIYSRKVLCDPVIIISTNYKIKILPFYFYSEIVNAQYLKIYVLNFAEINQWNFSNISN